MLYYKAEKSLLVFHKKHNTHIYRVYIHMVIR